MYKNLSSYCLIVRRSKRKAELWQRAVKVVSLENPYESHITPIATYYLNNGVNIQINT